MLRTLFVTALVLFGIRHAVRGPFYALLFYLWIAYFRPEQWVWGGSFVTSLPLSLLVGAVAIVSTVLSGKFVLNGRTMVLLLVVVQSLLSTLVSDYTAWSWPFWIDFAKSTLISCLLASLIADVKQLRMAMLVIALSLGFEAAKQGWAQLIFNPGAKNFNDIALLGDNNGVAVGMYVLVAILVGLARTAPRHWERWTHRFLAGGTLYRAISTYSRGGFLACSFMAVMYVLRSKRKVGAIFGFVIMTILIVPVLPTEFWDRIRSIGQVDINADPEVISQDDTGDEVSAVSRLHFWRVAVAMAAENPLTGVGHNAYMKAFDKYDFRNGLYGYGRSVHSAWFGTLAELGYPGLVLMGVNFALAFLACRRARRLPKDTPDAAHLREFAIAIETGLGVILIGGTFVIFQYTEMLWHLFGLSIALHRLVDMRLAAVRPEVVPGIATTMRMPAPGVVMPNLPGVPSPQPLSVSPLALPARNRV